MGKGAREQTHRRFLLVARNQPAAHERGAEHTFETHARLNMGKANRGKKQTVDKTDDELLDEAAAANRAAAAAALAETTSEMTLDNGCPTKAELLTALDSITLFDLRSAEVGDGKGRAPCLSPAGEFVFYVDENDAVEAIEARNA